MATSTVNATYQGYITKQAEGPLLFWVGEVRDATTGTSAITITTNTSLYPIAVSLTSGRSGYVGSCTRVFLFFDISSITSGNTITAATLKVWGTGPSQITDTIVVQGLAWGGGGGSSTLATSDYDNLDFDTAYSSKDLSWGGAIYNDFALNASAISDMNTNGYFNCAVIEGDYDYDGESPTVGTSLFAGVEFNDPTNKIKLELTYSPSGYGNIVGGISGASISNVVGVATANIANVIGVQ